VPFKCGLLYRPQAQSGLSKAFLNQNAIKIAQPLKTLINKGFQRFPIPKVQDDGR